jgi:glycosyltransferase involved in cell wall biosynthesis
MVLLAIDHTAILSADRSVYRAIASAAGLSVSLVVPLRWHELYGTTDFERDEQGLNVYGLPIWFPGRSHRAMYRGLGAVIRELQPHVIYANAEPESFLAWQVVALRRRYSRGSVVILDSWRNIDYRSSGHPYRLSSLHGRIELQTFREADHCVVHTDAARDQLRLAGYERTTVIPPAVDTTLFSGAVPSRAGNTPQHPFTIGYVGRFVAGKGIDLLINAVATVRGDKRLLLIGDGPLKRELEQATRRAGISDVVDWRGPIRHDLLTGSYREMDVLVLPSRSGKKWTEQFGRVLIEAMACGVPVVGSDSGEIPRVIGPAGRVFAEGKVESLVTQLQTLAADPALRLALGASGRQRVEQLYSVRVVAGMYRDLLERIAPSV